MLLVASEMVVTSEAAGCDIFQLVPCMAASKNAEVAPSKQYCTNIANMGKGSPGPSACALCWAIPWLSRMEWSQVLPKLPFPGNAASLFPRGFVCQGTVNFQHRYASLTLESAFATSDREKWAGPTVDFSLMHDTGLEYVVKCRSIPSCDQMCWELTGLTVGLHRNPSSWKLNGSGANQFQLYVGTKDDSDLDISHSENSD